MIWILLVCYAFAERPSASAKVLLWGHKNKTSSSMSAVRIVISVAAPARTRMRQLCRSGRLMIR